MLSPSPAAPTRPRRGCLRCGGCFAVACLLVAGVALLLLLRIEETFSLRSNLVYLEFLDSQAPLEIRSAKGRWLPLSRVDSDALEEALQRGPTTATDGFRWRTLTVRRPASGQRGKLVNAFCPAQVHLLEFDPAQFSFFPWFEREGSRFSPRTFRDALRSPEAGRGARFAINANYYGPDGQPLGWIVRDGHEIQPQWQRWSGFFFVKGGETHFGPRSALEATPGDLTQATQGYPSVMRDGRVWNYVSDNRDRFFNGSELTFRSLAGVTAEGKIVFVLSGQGGLLDMAEVTALAQLAGVRDATLLDGGRALQYGYRGPGRDRAFHSFNNTSENPLVPARLAPERPPVYLVVRRR